MRDELERFIKDRIDDVFAEVFDEFLVTETSEEEQQLTNMVADLIRHEIKDI